MQATRPTRPDPLPHDIAAGLIVTWTRFRVQPVTLHHRRRRGSRSRRRHGFSYWDSAIIAAARALGCDELYTEDMAHGREVDGLAIVNPFR